MAEPLHPTARTSQVVWLHLMVLALVASLGLIIAAIIGWSATPWPDIWGTCFWFAGLCVVTAYLLTARRVL